MILMDQIPNIDYTLSYKFISFQFILFGILMLCYNYVFILLEKI